MKMQLSKKPKSELKCKMFESLDKKLNGKLLTEKTLVLMYPSIHF